MKRERTLAADVAKQVQQKGENNDPPQSIKEPPPRLYLPTGVDVLNCAFSNRADGGWPSGRVSNMIGDSDTCKSQEAQQTLAEACYLPAFDEYRLLDIDIEGARTESGRQLFGPKFLDRVELWSEENENPKFHPPKTVEELHDFLFRLLKEDRPFVAVVDALDFLPSQADLDWNEKQRKAREKGEEASGTYQLQKPKQIKRMFSEIKGEICNTDSILIIVSQSIANIGSMFNPKTVAGGTALEYACRIRFWLSKLKADKIDNEIVGRQVKAKVSKNHITGNLREVHMWVRNQYGLDNTRSSIDYLLDKKVWKRVGSFIEAEHFKVKLQEKQLIRHIERNGSTMEKLRYIVQETWDRQEQALLPDRRARYV